MPSLDTLLVTLTEHHAKAESPLNEEMLRGIIQFVRYSVYKYLAD